MPDVFVAPEEETTPPVEKGKTGSLPSSTKPHKRVQSPPPPAATDPGHIDVTGNSIHLLTSFCEHPKDIRFENQEEHEHVHLFMRRHIITNLRWTLTTLLLILLPLLLPLFLQVLGPALITIPTRFIVFFLLFYYLILFGYGFVHFITWFYNVGIVTQMRIVDIDISHITHKNIAAVSINDVVDVTYIQHGLIHNLLDYGDIQLQTEGMKPNFEFHAVPKPAKVADIISDLIRGGKHE